MTGNELANLQFHEKLDAIKASIDALGKLVLAVAVAQGVDVSDADQ